MFLLYFVELFEGGKYLFFRKGLMGLGDQSVWFHSFHGEETLITTSDSLLNIDLLKFFTSSFNLGSYKLLDFPVFLE